MDKLLLVLLFQKDYSAVCHLDENGKEVQHLVNVEQAKRDCENIEEFFRKFGLTDEDVIVLTNLGFKALKAQLDKKIRDPLIAEKRQKTRTPKNLCFAYVLAGHGVMNESMANFVLSEYCEQSKWYRIYPIEQRIRGFAKTYPSSYHVVFNVCCRQDYKVSKLCFPMNDKSKAAPF